MSDVRRIGFTELTGSKDVTRGPYRVNIIFVHGLRGHPRRTWEDERVLVEKSTTTRSKRKALTSFFRSKSSTTTPDTPAGESSSSARLFWPNDFLTRDIPNARIWTYGYNADAIGFLYRAKNQNTISQHGQELANQIELELGNEVKIFRRSRCEVGLTINQDPIVFVAHSLGGILVKDAIRRSEICRARTKLVVFLGTPHRGSQSTGWGELAANMAQLALQDSNKTIIKTLEVNSEVLDIIHEQFITIVLEDKLQVYSFQEAQGISGMKGLHNKVVDDFSSKLGLSRSFERVGSIHANHMQMARCSCREGTQYRAILSVLRQFLGSEAFSKERTRSQGQPETSPSKARSDAGEETAGGGKQDRGQFLVPYTSNSDFVGRSAILEQLKGQLGHLQQPQSPSRSQPRASLHGLGGIGKTQIALAYVYWLQETYPETSVFWVHASNAERFRQALASIAQDCGIPGHTDPKADLLSLVKRWLEKRANGGWLMVIDNADDTQLFFGEPETGGSTTAIEAGNLGRYLPECSHGSILVTTRNMQTGSKLTKGRRSIEVKKLGDDESDQLLRAKLDGVEFGSDELSKLSSRLEHLPLALVQAAAFIQENTITVSEYLRLLDESDQGFVELLSERFETVGRDSETPHAVTATWIISFEQIQEQNTFAGELLSLMSLFDRQAIPMEFLLHYGEQQHDNNSRGSIQLTKALGVLKAFSFLAEEKGNGLDMHRLVQLVMRKWLVKKGVMDQFAERALLAVSHTYPSGRFETWQTCRDYLPHVYAVLRWKGAESKDERAAKATLLHKLAWFLDDQGEWKDAEKFLVQATEIRKSVLGDEHPDTLNSIANLASTFRNQGRWKEAEDLEVQVMETRKMVLGDEHPDTLTSIANLASTFRNQGRWKEAEDLEVQVMETRKMVLGDEHPDTLTSMANLASTFWNQGRWKEAEDLDVQVVETRKRVLGDEHPNTLTSTANLASTFWNQGRWKEAEDLDVQVVEISSRVLGDEHPDTLTSMANLASTFRNLGRWKEAEDLEVQVIETSSRVLGDEHPDTLSSMANLALTFWNQGRWKEAEDLGVQVVETRKRVLGDEHPNTLTSMANLASTFGNQGWWKEAEDLEVQVIETSSRVLGDEHPDTLTSMNNLAFTLKDQGRLGDALVLMQKCCSLRTRVLGVEHPYTISSLSALRGWQQESGGRSGITHDSAASD